MRACVHLQAGVSCHLQEATKCSVPLDELTMFFSLVRFWTIDENDASWGTASINELVTHGPLHPLQQRGAEHGAVCQSMELFSLHGFYLGWGRDWHCYRAPLALPDLSECPQP